VHTVSKGCLKAQWDREKKQQNYFWSGEKCVKEKDVRSSPCFIYQRKTG